MQLPVIETVEEFYNLKTFVYPKDKIGKYFFSDSIHSSSITVAVNNVLLTVKKAYNKNKIRHNAEIVKKNSLCSFLLLF